MGDSAAAANTAEKSIVEKSYDDLLNPFSESSESKDNVRNMDIYSRGKEGSESSGYYDPALNPFSEEEEADDDIYEEIDDRGAAGGRGEATAGPVVNGHSVESRTVPPPAPDIPLPGPIESWSS